MTLSKIASKLNISRGGIEYFATTESYNKAFAGADSSPENVFDAMKKIQDAVGNNLSFLGGQTVRPFSMGSRQVRVPSADIDAVVHSLEGLKALAQLANSIDSPFFLHQTGVCFFLLLNSLPISVHHKAVYDVPLDIYRDTIEFNSNGTKLRFIRPEMLTTLKSRRGFYRDGGMRPKDAMDIGNMILASKEGKIEFDPKRQARYVRTIDGSLSLGEIKGHIDARDNFTPEEKRKIRGFFYKV